MRLRKWLDVLPLAQPARGLLCGLIVGLFAVYEPHTLTWGEPMMEPLSRSSHSMSMSTLDPWLLRLGVLKFVTTIVTTTSGYSAGIVFPLMFIGYSVGTGLSSPLTVLVRTFTNIALDESTDLSFGHCMSSAMLAGTMHVSFGT